MNCDQVSQVDVRLSSSMHSNSEGSLSGRVGRATAIDLARHGVRVASLDDDGALASGSRARICNASMGVKALLPQGRLASNTSSVVAQR